MELISGGTLNFALKHGWNLLIKNVPVGTTYTVNETGADDYTTNVKYTNGDNETTENNTKTGTEKNVVLGANIQEFINDKTSTTPTGVIMDVLPFAIMIVLAAFAGVILFAKKRKATGTR